MSKIEKLSREERNKLLKLLKEKDGDEGEDPKRMDWMVESEETTREDYLLGKRIDSTEDLGLLDEASKRYYKSEVDNDILERTAHQDMLTKMHEDPLYLIKNQEESRRRKLLQNTVRLKKLKALISKQNEKTEDTKKKKKKKKEKKKSKRKGRDISNSDSSSDSDDSLLDAYVSLLRSKKTVKEGSSESERRTKRGSSQRSPSPNRRRPFNRRHQGQMDDRRSRRSGSQERFRRHSRSPGPLRRRSRSPRGPSSRRFRSPERLRPPHRRPRSREPRRKSRSRSCEPRRRSRSRSRDRPSGSSRDGARRPPRQRSRSPPPKAAKRSQEEMNRLREEMMQNATVRDEERRDRLLRHKVEEKKELENEEMEKQFRRDDFIASAVAKHASRSSLEEEVKRRIFKTQRTGGGAVSREESFVRR